MDVKVREMRWRVLAVCLSVVMMPVVVGCVSRSAFDAEVEKNHHLQYVKTEQDIEREGLHADVGALRRAYSEQSLRMTFVEGAVKQTAIELKTIQEKLSGVDAKFAALGQEMKSQQGDFRRVTAQGNEVMRLLEQLNAKQEDAQKGIGALTKQVDGVRKKVLASQGPMNSTAQHGKQLQKSKQEVGAPQVDKKEFGTSGRVTDESARDEKGGETASALSPLSEAQGSEPAGLVVAGEKPSVGDDAQNSALQKTVDTGDRSPLLKGGKAGVVVNEGAPVKKSWSEWASDRWKSAKEAVIGGTSQAQTIQTAADPSNGLPSSGKK